MIIVVNVDWGTALEIVWCDWWRLHFRSVVRLIWKPFRVALASRCRSERLIFCRLRVVTRG